MMRVRRRQAQGLQEFERVLVRVSLVLSLQQVLLWA